MRLGLRHAHVARLATAMLVALPLVSSAQDAPNAPSIVPCEGPDMPAACPRPSSSVSGGSTEAAHAAFIARQASLLQKQQQFLSQHQGLAGRMAQARHDSLSRQPPTQTNPLLSPPNFRAAAQAVSAIVNPSGGHD